MKITENLEKSLNDRAGINLQNPEDFNKLLKCFNKYIPLIISVCLSVSFVFVAVTDFNKFLDSNFIYLVLISLPILTTFIFWMPLLQTTPNVSYEKKVAWNIFIILITGLLTYLIYFLYGYLTPFDITVIGIIRIIIFTIFTILLIYIIYNLIYEHFVESRGILGFIIGILILIPQTIIDIIMSIYKTFTTATITTKEGEAEIVSTFYSFIIMVFLIIAVLVYLFFADIVGLFKKLNGKTNSGGGGNSSPHELLLKGPNFINNETAITLNNPPTISNHAFSFWIYINNSPTTNYEMPIFKYSSGMPYVTINNNMTNNMNFYPSEYFVANSQPLPFNIYSQKWNYFVIQYVSTPATPSATNTVQFYINGVLLNSTTFTETNKPIFTLNDNIVTLGNNNIASQGIGAISNVNYYTTPLTEAQINLEYEQLASQNIPVV